MGFVEAVKTGLSKYATFQGRARRSEYWWFYVFYILSQMAGLAVDVVVIGNELPILAWIILAALVLPQLAVSVRRLHDTGRSGWMMLISLIPLVGGIWLLVLTVLDSEPRDNEYGPWPKYTPEQLASAPA